MASTKGASARGRAREREVKKKLEAEGFFVSEKVCPKCETVKPRESFAKGKRFKDGLQAWCRECTSAARKRIYAANKEREAARVKKWAQENRERMVVNALADRERHRDRWDARDALNKAVKKGAIEKPEHCARCEETEYLQAHHDDYSKPLDVEWLCRDCHYGHHHGEVHA